MTRSDQTQGHPFACEDKEGPPTVTIELYLTSPSGHGNSIMSNSTVKVPQAPLRELIRKARAICPKCGAKGVGYAPHQHAFGWKDYGRAQCRYCHARFKFKEPLDKS